MAILSFGRASAAATWIWISRCRTGVKSAATMFGMVMMRHMSTFGAGVAGVRGAGVATRHSVVPAAQRLPLLNARASADVYAYAEQELSTLCLHGVGAVQLHPTGWVGVSVPATSAGVGVKPVGVITAGAGVRSCSVGIGVEPVAAAVVDVGAGVGVDDGAGVGVDVGAEVGVPGAGVVAAVGDRVGESVGVRVGEGFVVAVGAGVAMGEAAEEGAAGVGTAV